MIQHILDYQQHLEDLADIARWDDDGGSMAERVPFASPVLVGWRPLEQSIADTRYSSMAEYMHAVKDECVNPENRKLHKSWVEGECWSPYRRSLPTKQYLGGFNNASEAMRLYDTGWPEGIERARKLLEDFEVDAVPHDHRRRMRWGDAGDHLDISRVYAGHHNQAWQSARRKYTMAPKRVTIVANLICPWNSPADTLFWRGAACIVLSDLLEAAGYMTKIDIGEGGAMRWDCFKEKWKYPANNLKMSHRATIKDFGDPIDISTATATLHGGFNRASTQAWTIGHCPVAITYVHFQVGVCVTDEGDILASHEVHDEFTARKWIREQLNKINEEENNV